MGCASLEEHGPGSQWLAGAQSKAYLPLTGRLGKAARLSTGTGRAVPLSRWYSPA